MAIHQINPAAAKKLLEEKRAVLVDVREKEEYEKAYIEHARLLPLSSVTLDEAHLPEHRDKKLILHCRSGKRSMMACEKLQAEAPEQEFYNMEGGILAWESQGLPIYSLNIDYVLDRRAQIILGLCMIVVFLLLEILPDVGSKALAVLAAALIIDGFLAKGWFASVFSATPKREK